MGCHHSKQKIIRLPKYKRNDLSIIVPQKKRGEHLYTLQRPTSKGDPDIIYFQDGVVKKTFPDNILGKKRFENEIAAYNLLKTEYFIAEIFDIDYKNRCFSTYETKKHKFDLSIVNKSYRIHNILIDKYGIEYCGDHPHIYLRCNGDMIFFQGLSKIPIKHKINDDWKYFPKPW